MPTVISHLAVPLAIGIGAGRKLVSLPLLAVGAVGSVLPDLDVIGFRYGIAYANSFGHRGASHSIAAAILFGALVAIIAPLLRCKRSIAFVFAAICFASHPLLDMFTDAGLGVALFWPFAQKRYFASWRPIDASPLSVERVLSERGWEIFQTELIYVWLPMAVLCVTLMAIRRDARMRA